MIDGTDMLNQIERNEAWLRASMPPPPPRSLEPLKLRVRVAVHETWLEREAAGGTGILPLNSWAGSPCHGLLGPVKAAVRDEVARIAAQHGRASRQPSYWKRLGLGLAAAAAIGFAALLLRPAEPNQDQAAAVPPGLRHFVAVLEETVPEPAGRLQAAEWVELDSEMLTLEQSIAEQGIADSGRSGWEETELDDLRTELETLLDEIELGS